MAQIFVSYCTENEAAVEPVVRELQHAFCGEVFYYREQDCSSDPLISDSLRNAIENSEALICFISEAAGRSRWVKGELEIAVAVLGLDRIRFVRVQDSGPDIPKAFTFRCTSDNRVIFERDYGGPRELAAEIRRSLSHLRWRPDVDVASLLEAYLRDRESYIWRPDPKSPETGLAVREPERHDGTPSCAYSELTGFLVLECMRLYDLTGKEKFLEEASDAAGWLVHTAMDKDRCGILTRYYFSHDKEAHYETTSFSGRQVYAFDTAICLIALASLSRRWGHLDAANPGTPPRRYNFKKEARKIGDFICDSLVGHGSEGDSRPLAAVYSLKEDHPLPDESRWSRRFGPHHARVAEALAELHHLTRHSRYRECAVRICDAILRLQDPEGDFETSPGMTELHPLSYGAEGLLRVGELLNEPRYVDAARLAVEWSLDQQSEDGSIPQSFCDGAPLGPKEKNYRTDVLAQVLWVAARLGLAEEDREYRPKVDKLVQFLLQLEKTSGGFPFGFLHSSDGTFPRCTTRSYWPGMYAVDALTAYQVSRLAHDARVIVLAGGRGTRLWPLSCTRVPKPLSSAMLGNRSLLEETLQRYTRSRLIPAENVYVLCSGEVRRTALKLCMREGVPSDHVLSDIGQGDEGALPALKVGIQRMSDPDDRPKDTRFGARIVLVSLADDVFDPWDAPCGVIQRMLLAVGREGSRECKSLVLLGAPAAGHDARFGHVSYPSQPRTVLGCSRVARFLAKPETPPWGAGPRDEIAEKWAWDCGTLVALGSTWKEILGAATGRDLDRDVLASAPAGSLTVAVLHPSTRFDDFGVPGKNLLNFFRGRACEKHGNVVLGTGPDGEQKDHVRLLCASGNVIITDRRKVDVYGLHNQLIIDSATTNASLVMPLDKTTSFHGVYENFSAVADLKPFLEGGRDARRAPARQQMINSPGSRCPGGHTGLVAVLDSPDVVLNRSDERLSVRRESPASPDIDEESLAVLVKRQDEDPKLIEHLVHVYAIGRALVGASPAAQLGQEALDLRPEFCEWILWPVLLFHDFGGCLDPAAEDREQAVLRDLERVTKLNRRHLDTLVLDQLLALRGLEADRRSRGATESPTLFNDDVTSAVKFLQAKGESYLEKKKVHLLDVAVILLQCHDSPERFKSFVEDYPNFAGAWEKSARPGYPVRMPTLDEVMDMYALVRISDSLSFANWHWKREKVSIVRPDVDPHKPEPADTTLAYLRGKLRLAGFSDERAARWCEYVEQRVGSEPLKGILDTLRKDD